MTRIEQAKTYESRDDLRKRNKSLYNFLVKYFSDELDGIFPRVARRKYTRQTCIERARECSSYKEFRERYPQEYRASIHYGYDARKIFDTPITKEQCFDVMKGCITRIQCLERSRKIYSFMVDNGWVDEYFNSLWKTEEDLVNLAMQFNSIQTFKRTFPNAYKYMIWHNIKAFGHMESRLWNKDKVLSAARKCKSYKEFRLQYGLYNYALKHNLINECKKILGVKEKKRKNEVDFMKLLRDCGSLSVLRQKHRNYYQWASLHNLLYKYQHVK